MKTKDIAEKYGFDKFEFEVFLEREHLKCSGTLVKTIDDSLVDDYVERFNAHKREERKKAVESAKAAKEKKKKKKELEEAAQRRRIEIQRCQEEHEKKKQRELSKMLISSGFSFEGYNIVKYSGYISGDDAVQIPRSGIFTANNNGLLLTNALVEIRRQALQELKEAAYNLGCNAIIGVDFDYITLDPQTANITGGTTYEPYVICVTANGNAVIIEKNE